MMGSVSSAFKIRVFLWFLAAVALVLGAVLSWWLVLVTVAAVIVERVVAVKERSVWTGLAALLLAETRMSAGCAVPQPAKSFLAEPI
jgi:hypothetical protein